MKRLERFFGVEDLPEAQYDAEYTAKEEALVALIDKLLRSQRFLQALAHGAAKDAEDMSSSLDPHSPAAWSLSKTKASLKVSAQNDEAFEVSYVIPPSTVPEEDGLLHTFDGPRRWHPRLVWSHQDGGMALCLLSFEHVAKGKDREERWACTKLRCDLIASPGGEPTLEEICDLRGPVPHGVRYMRI